MKKIRSFDEIIALLTGQPVDRSHWVQVGKLTKEEEGVQRSHLAKADERRMECDVLQKKIHALMAAQSADGEEFWMNLKKAHGLGFGNYHILDDGRIVMEPKNDQKEN